MAQHLPHDHEEVRKANRLYWESDQSVNAVAESLGVSKGRLYDLVVPLSLGTPCPDCGADLAFPNRTARDRGLVTCDTCGFEGDREELEVSEGELGGDLRSGRDRPGVPGPEGGLESAARDLLRNPIVLGGLMVGAVAGVLLGRWLRD